jgi:FkbM family methyltransferase
MDQKRALDRVEPETWYAKQEFRLLLHRLRRLPPPERGKLQGLFTEELLSKTLDVETRHGPLSFVLLSEMAAGRALSLLRKQPETIDWIDSFAPDSVFWDIGANIGIYTLYAARRGDIRVVAFEPAAVNYFLLTANCEVNHLEDRVDCLLTGVADGKAVAQLGVSQFAPGDSFSFGDKRGREESSRQAVFVVSIDQLVDEYGLTCPNYIKIDVPALTVQIIAGAVRTLQRPEVRQLHIEMKEDSVSGRGIIEMLGGAGFVIAGRHTHRQTTDVTFARQATG